MAIIDGRRGILSASWTTILLLLVGSYTLYAILYQLFFSPLNKIPGPFMARIANTDEAKALKAQRRAQWVGELFEKYSWSVAVRTGPNSVAFNHPDAVKAIYGHGKGADEFGKSSWYDAFSTTGESLFSTRSKKQHAMKRRMVAHGFSAQSLLLFEPYVDATLSRFMRRMDTFAATGEPFDLYFWFELFTMDLMGELALGDHFGVLETGKPARYAALVEQSQRFANMSGMLPFGRHNVRVLSWVPLPSVQRLYRARLEYLDYAKKALERRQPGQTASTSLGTSARKPRQDIIQRFIEAQDPETGHRMDFEELRAETSSLMVAGASTGSVTMSWMIYYLCKNAGVKDRLVRDLVKTLPSSLRAGTKEIPFTSINKLSLLENAMIECLRLHPPIGYAMPRDTPPQGAVICGVFVPGGVAVGVPAATIGRDGNVFPLPHVWDPYRWGDKGGGDLATMRTCMLGFGHGSRQCIGRNVATQFVMKMVATLLLRYEIELEDPSLVLGTKEFTIQKPDQRWNVVLKPRA